MTTRAPAVTTTALAVTSLGMVSSLGLDVVASCAAARARLSMPAPIENLDVAGEAAFGRETDDGPPLVHGHHVRGVAEGFSGFARLALLAESALVEALGAAAMSPREAAAASLIVCVPDRFIAEGERPEREAARSTERAERLVTRLARHSAWAAEPSRRAHRLGGAGAFAAALLEAARQIGAGQAEHVVIGAVDSRIDPHPVRALAALGQVRTNLNPAGAMPGEAAAFAVVERAQGSGAARALSTIARASSAREEASLLDADRPPTGKRLAEAIRTAAGEARIPWLITDLTGSARRATEWGHAVVRARDLLEEPRIWTPAMSFGDVGTAAGAVALCVATRAFQRGYAAAPAALISLSSEDGEKGALSVRAGGA